MLAVLALSLLRGHQRPTHDFLSCLNRPQLDFALCPGQPSLVEKSVSCYQVCHQEVA